MSKRIGISEPLVLTSEFRPLQNVTFEVLTNDEPLDQWYYQNTGIFKPNRAIENLILTPRVTVVVPETKSKVDATIKNWPVWEFLENGTWKTVGVTDPSNTGFVRSGNTLVISRNVYPTNPIQLRVSLVYLDPRSVTKEYQLQDSLVLNTSQDSDQLSPNLFVDAPNFQSFNPIKDDDNSFFSFVASGRLGDRDVSSILQFEWYILDKQSDADLEGVLAENVPAFFEAPSTMVLPPEEGGSSDPQNPTIITNGGQHSDTILIDARYGKHLTVILKARYRYTYIQNPAQGSNPHALGWYEMDATEVQNVTPSQNPKALGWYEEAYGQYLPSEDEVASTSKLYFIVTYTVSADTSVQSGTRYYTTNGELFPASVYKTVVWENFKINVETACDGGNAVDSTSGDKFFKPIATIKGGTLTDEEKTKHLLFKWYKRNSNARDITKQFCGYGNGIVLSRDDIWTGDWYNKVVYPEVYLREELRRTVNSNEPVYLQDKNDQTKYYRVYSRT